MAIEVTGVDHTGITVLSPAETGTFRPRPCDVGSVHVGLTVADIHAGVALELIQLAALEHR